MDVYEVDWTDGNQDIAESVMWAADEGKPLVVTLDKGRTVRMVPDTEAKPAPKKPANPLDGVVVEPVAEERRKVLRVSGLPDLTDDFGLTVTPSTVWLMYRQEEGEAPELQRAHVNGYRVPRKNVPEDFTGITLLPGTHDLPDWLTALAAAHMPV
ncbi:hypothetical protein [Streptomyces ipomoeae]|uniref:hypothetical protein n=1 Tax=Streptomyces ipomoeae TaxID=103232 RepID=UPI001147220E|nr:hypothetical protein [Streptomyces ipomoeae]TQE33038.1 hypothetical protein Sipo7851_21275 [Streptomyces ipomoeae]